MNGVWRHFSEAEADVIRHSNNIGIDGNLRRSAVFALAMMLNAQRFFIPKEAVAIGAAVEKGKKVMWPYPQLAVLFEDDERSAIFDGWTIVLANLLSETEIKLITLHLGTNGWVPGPPYEGRVVEPYGFDAAPNALLGLCEMLACVNVSAESVSVPSALAAKRARTGKKPLYDYHVLKVGGDSWHYERPHGGGSSDGYRSHLRRGHVRRLDEARRTWVRATFVHGAVDGFVDKDYEVKKNPELSCQ